MCEYTGIKGSEIFFLEAESFLQLPMSQEACTCLLLLWVDPHKHSNLCNVQNTALCAMDVICSTIYGELLHGSYLQLSMRADLLLLNNKAIFYKLREGRSDFTPSI